MQFGKFDSDAFLRDTWQQRPLLIRNPWRGWRNPIDPEELAGLACEREVESRLIVQGGHGLELEHGPFDAARFAALGKDPWTLLVQAVDHHVPDVAALIEPFRFIPDWRIDDVMVSYATTGGGVGPHFDQYDVFLIQGLGTRRWQLGGECSAATELQPNGALRSLANFRPEQEWTLGPGDMLYVPPRFAHNGIAASDDCMTYSIGFRAPSRGELIANWSEDVAGDLDDEDRYDDPGLSRQDNPGEISPSAIDRLHGLVTEKMLDRDAFAHWFARYSTTPKYPDIDWRPECPIDAAEVRGLLGAQVPLLRNPARRFSFFRDAGSVWLFVDGQSYECTGVMARFAQALCASPRVDPSSETIAASEVTELLVTLINQGSLAFELEE